VIQGTSGIILRWQAEPRREPLPLADTSLKSFMLSVRLPQTSMPGLMCGWGCHVWMGMSHGFAGSVGKLKAAAQALDAIGTFLVEKL
jgi:cytochrome b subunit of formate dehydrogenase